jgi:hypothetical protein
MTFRGTYYRTLKKKQVYSHSMSLVKNRHFGTFSLRFVQDTIGYKELSRPLINDASRHAVLPKLHKGY